MHNDKVIISLLLTNLISSKQVRRSYDVINLGIALKEVYRENRFSFTGFQLDTRISRP